MDAVQEILRRHEAIKAQQAQQASQQSSQPAPQSQSDPSQASQVAQQPQVQWEEPNAQHPSGQPASLQHTAHQPQTQPQAQLQSQSQQPSASQYESSSEDIHPMFRAGPHHHHQHHHQPQHANNNGHPAPHTSQPPSPPSFQDPFVRQQPNAQHRRPSKQLQQRAPVPPHQSIPPQQASPANSTASASTYYSEHHPPPPHIQSQPQHALPSATSAPNPGLQPRLSVTQPQTHMNQQHPQHPNRSSVSYERSSDPALPQGRVASPSAQPNYAPQSGQQGSYARRPSYGGPPSDSAAYQMPAQRPVRPENVTIFMDDYRHGHNGEPEHLLAEVSIQLRTSTTHDGFWANAQELVEQLQAGPSRIDGPAKVFCRRGKYKHCFMRMNDANDIECQPSSLQISPESSIQVMIESNKMLHAQQHRSAPYHVPSRSSAAARINSPRPSVQHDLPPGQSLMHPVPREAMNPEMHHHYGSAASISPPMRTSGHSMSLDAGRRGSAAAGPITSPQPHRKRSIADGSPTNMAMDIDDRPTKRPSISSLSGGHTSQSGYGSGSKGPPYGGHRPSTSGSSLPPQAGGSGSYEFHSPPGDASRERTPTQSLSNPNSINNLREASNSNKEPASPPGGRGSFDDGQWRAPRAQVNTAIANWLKPQIQREEGYAEFMHSKGHVLTVPQLLRVYGFAQRQIQKWNNTRTPENADGCPLKKIGKSNVLQALGRQTSWGSDCEQTLAFVDKYGPGGSRENERVVALVNGKIMPGEKEGSVYFLSVLRDVDREWRAQNEARMAHGSGTHNGGGSAAGDSMDEDRRSSLESGSSHDPPQQQQQSALSPPAHHQLVHQHAG